MDENYLINPAVFLIQTIFGIYTLAVLLRFILQIVRADFYNPVSQFLVKITAPPLRVLRRIIPGYAGIDLAALLLAWIVKSVELGLILMITGVSFSFLGPLLWSLPELVELTINIFLFAVIIQVVLSWISPGIHNPASTLLYSLTEPVLKPARTILPPLSGLDLSPMLVLIGFVLLKMLLLPPLRVITDSPFQ